ncbi:unnamed protein product [Ceutorhynchus assimilis]|uniref:DUF4806 domain-containing protein n=1 Tax=Ceutorhynchus assimilis TaxID=467358 RepID=A0A9N9MJU9_9CUCU|nr:unnamed protein product [Ceutorhynchus assimilis]
MIVDNFEYRLQYRTNTKSIWRCTHARGSYLCKAKLMSFDYVSETASMNVLVKWCDGTENIVLSSQIQLVNKSESFEKGAKIKMYWKPEKQWYFGVVIEIEKDSLSSSDSESKLSLKILRKNSDNSSDDDIPLQLIKQELAITAVCQNFTEVMNKTDLSNTSNIIEVDQRNNVLSFRVDQWEASTSANLDVSGQEKLMSSHSNNSSDFEPNSDEVPTCVQTCELNFCQEEVWSACPNCSKLLCWDHVVLESCDCKGVVPNLGAPKKVVDIPINYTVEGNPSGNETGLVLKKKENTKKTATEMRNLGNVSYKSRKIMPARKVLGARCNGTTCFKMGKKCALLREEERTNILNDFYGKKKSTKISLKTIVANQKIMMQRQSKFQKSLDTLTETIYEYFNKPHDEGYIYNEPAQASTSEVAKRPAIEPIGSPEKLSEFEEKLKQENYMLEVVESMSYICGKSGTSIGIDCCYKLIDHFLTRSFATQCSWTGNTRQGPGMEKVPLKFFENFRKCFRSIITLADSKFTEAQNEDFFKRILKNSVRRQQSTSMRQSKHKNRPKNLKYNCREWRSDYAEPQFDELLEEGEDDSYIKLEVNEADGSRSENDKNA